MGDGIMLGGVNVSAEIAYMDDGGEGKETQWRHSGIPISEDKMLKSLVFVMNGAKHARFLTE